jgi:hypothetical protein
VARAAGLGPCSRCEWSVAELAVAAKLLVDEVGSQQAHRRQLPSDGSFR